MIPPFTLKTPKSILFGADQFSRLGKLLPAYGRAPLLVLGNASFQQSARFREILDIFAALNFEPLSVHIDSEPTPEQIDLVVAEYQHRGLDFVIAIGGGSTIDGGKAISAMLAEQLPVQMVLEGVGTATPSGAKLPFIAIPTTAGTGSEATSNAVICSVGPAGYKKSLRHDNYIPDLALVDPTLALSCSKELTAACSMDCFTQLVEGYLSTNGSPVTDLLALEGLKGLQRSLRRVYQDGDNLAARADLAYGALLSGIVLCNGGLGTIHGFASTIGGMFHIPHGLVCGTLMAQTNLQTLNELRKTSQENIALVKYTRLGQLMSARTGKTDSWYQDFFIEELLQLTEDLQIQRLGDFGVTADDITAIVQQTSNKYNPVQLSNNSLAAILHSRL